MSKPLVLIPQYFGSLVFDRRTSRYLPFDTESTTLLKRLAVDPDAAREAEDFYAYFASLGFFDLEGRLAAEVLDLTPPGDHLAGPLAVHLEIIEACNLACAHCFAGGARRPGDRLTPAELDDLFATLASLGSYRLGLTGGEPLLRPDILDIVDAAIAHGLHPCLTTNALLIDEEIARELGRRDLVWINVSLDGATATTNDLIRGAGTYSRVREGIAILGRYARFTLAFTITAISAAETAACAELARSCGAQAAVFRPLYPVGTAAGHPELMPTYAQYMEALESLTGDLRTIDVFGPRRREGNQARVVPHGGCGAANLVCSVSVDGRVSPCSFLGPDASAGNVRSRPFREIWDESVGFTAFRCRGDEEFRGGCRARAFAANGSVHARDPWFEDHERRCSPDPEIAEAR